MVAGHGKGLVDSMSGFGAKTPLRMRVLQRDEFFNDSLEIVTCLKDIFRDDPSKVYHCLKEEEFLPVSSELVIKGSSEFHMMAYHPDGSIQTRDYICSCSNCSSKGLFNDCLLSDSEDTMKGFVILSSIKL